MEEKNHSFIYEYFLIWPRYFGRTSAEYVIGSLLICIAIIYLFTEMCTFASVLTQRTFNLLEETESTAYNAHGWLHSEALSGTGVQEWGTFRKALWKRIYSAVVPILAEIIAFADRDRNLDLMKDGMRNIWVSTLWLKIMVDPNISELSYSKMISPVTNSVRERVPVIGSGAGGHSFQCLFPFSFIVKQRVDKMLKDAFSVTGNSQLGTLRATKKLFKCPSDSFSSVTKIA